MSRFDLDGVTLQQGDHRALLYASDYGLGRPTEWVWRCSCGKKAGPWVDGTGTYAGPPGGGRTAATVALRKHLKYDLDAHRARVNAATRDRFTAVARIAETADPADPAAAAAQIRDLLDQVEADQSAYRRAAARSERPRR